MPNTSLASGLDPKSISRDEKVVQAYINDPLVHDKIYIWFWKDHAWRHKLDAGPCA